MIGKINAEVEITQPEYIIMVCNGGSIIFVDAKSIEK